MVTLSPSPWASMGPRSGERGELVRATAATTLGLLQWGRARVSAERLAIARMVTR